MICHGGPLDGGDIPSHERCWVMVTFYDTEDADSAMNYIYEQHDGCWVFSAECAQAAARDGLREANEEDRRSGERGG